MTGDAAARRAHKVETLEDIAYLFATRATSERKHQVTCAYCREPFRGARDSTIRWFREHDCDVVDALAKRNLLLIAAGIEVAA